MQRSGSGSICVEGEYVLDGPLHVSKHQDLRLHKGPLGPLMFILVLNDLPQAIRCGSINMYADDTTLYTAAKATEETIDMLRTDAQSTLD